MNEPEAETAPDDCCKSSLPTDLHWFDRLAITRGEEVPIEIIPSGPRKRIAIMRRKKPS